MKLHDALRKISGQYGTAVLQEKRLMAMLADFRAFDDFPAVKRVMKSMADDGDLKQICSLAQGGDMNKARDFAEDVKKRLIRDLKYRKDVADYAVGSILYALGITDSVSEPDDHSFDPFESSDERCQGGQEAAGGIQAENNQGNSHEPPGTGSAEQDTDYELGRKYISELDYKAAAKCFLAAASRGNADAQYSLGRLYEDGHGVGQDYGEALGWYRSAAGQGHSEALKRLRSAAGRGNAAAQVSLGMLCENGSGVAKDLSEALDWYRKAAEQGDKDGLGRLEQYAGAGNSSDAQKKLGRLYETGHGVRQNCKESVKWYSKAAGQGDSEALNKLEQLAGRGNSPDAQYALGQMYEAGHGVSEDLEVAVSWYGRAAGQGHPEALKALERVAGQGNTSSECVLGRLYHEGKGVTKNAGKAAGWYSRAAAQGSADAQLMLARMYDQGEGVQRDPEEAAKWFFKAAEQGNADAEYRLGRIYEEGTVAEQDYAKALKWYRQAAVQGNKYAEDKLKKDSLELFSRATEQNDAAAQYSLSQMYQSGKGIRQDSAEALKWLQRAAHQGNTDAQIGLGKMYAEGNGVSQDYSEALKWYRKAADQGSGDAQYIIGSMFENGNGTPGDAAGAATWYRRAAESGNKPAMTALRKSAESGNAQAACYLGQIYESGRCVDKNYGTALRWYRKAAEDGNKSALSAIMEAAESGKAAAQYTLGQMYESGGGVAKDGEVAARWYRKAAEGRYSGALSALRKAAGSGNAAAQYYLGRMYETGQGAEKNKKEAVRWYRSSAKQGNGDSRKALWKLRLKLMAPWLIGLSIFATLLVLYPVAVLSVLGFGGLALLVLILILDRKSR